MQSSKFQVTFDTLKGFEFDFSDLPIRIKCTICHGILINAKQSPCGCRFCQECLRVYINNSSATCPGNSSECNDIMLSENDFTDDNFANREISEFKIKCPNHLCNFEGMIKNISEHLELCEFNLCSCPICLGESKVIEKQSVFPEEMITCKFCGVKYQSEQMKTIHHNINNINLCDRYQSVCQYNCGVSEIVILKNHIRVCTNRPLDCPFFEMGCNNETILQMDMNNHLCNNSYKHTKIILEMISNLSNEVKIAEIQLISKDKELENFKTKLKCVEIQYDEVKNENLIIKHDIEENKAELLSIRALINGLNQDGIFDNRINNENNIIQTLVTKVDQNTNEIGSIQRIIMNQDLKYETKFIDYIWKIENYNKISQDSEDFADKRYFHSKPFFPMRTGYRLRLVLQPFNHNLGFISVFFQIMSSRFDEVLQWPFKYDVSLTIIDQEGDDDKIFNLFYDPTDEVQQRIYKKPENDVSEMYGIKEFIKRKTLNRTTQYVKNDAMFIKCSIKPINFH